MKKNNNEGWVCPKCGRVYAPWVEKCQYCGSNTITYTPLTCPYHPLSSYPWCINDTITTDRVTINANDFGTTTSASTIITNKKEV